MEGLAVDWSTFLSSKRPTTCLYPTRILKWNQPERSVPKTKMKWKKISTLPYVSASPLYSQNHKPKVIHFYSVELRWKVVLKWLYFGTLVKGGIFCLFDLNTVYINDLRCDREAHTDC